MGKLKNYCRRVAGALAVAAAVGEVAAAPVLGERVFWDGGDVSITIGPSDARLVSEIWLFDAGGSFYLGTNRDTGLSTVLDSAALDVNHDLRDELVFGIRVLGTGDTFLTGPGDRNPDGISHATVDFFAPGKFNVCFEDRRGGGDRDYNDVCFQAVESRLPAPVPNPGSLALAGMALLGVRRWASRSAQEVC